MKFSGRVNAYLDWCGERGPLVGLFFAVFLPIAVLTALFFPLTYLLAGGRW